MMPAQAAAPRRVASAIGTTLATLLHELRCCLSYRHGGR